MTDSISRRRFIGAAVGGVVAMSCVPKEGLMAQQAPEPNSIPVIDTHIHLFDTTRPQGIPWPNQNNAQIYKPTLPSHFRELVVGLNVVGAIEVECSTWLDDNQWVLDVSEKDTIMVGTVGNLEPGKPEFAGQLERFRKNPLFRGIRYGNLWSRNLGAELSKPPFVADLKLLAEAGLVLDSANPTPQLLADLVRVTDLVPNLRVVVDHLPGLARSAEGAAREMYDTSMKQLAQRPQVYVKVSQVLKRVNNVVARDLASNRAKLDEMFDTFGPDRLLYGSDWPNSVPVATYQEVLSIVRDYFLAKGREVAEKYFWKNSITAYRWIKRAPNQPQ